MCGDGTLVPMHNNGLARLLLTYRGRGNDTSPASDEDAALRLDGTCDTYPGSYNIRSSADLLALRWSGCSRIEGDLSISRRAAPDLSGLSSISAIGGSLEIAWLDTLVDLDGLDQLERVGGSISIVENERLSSLHGLDRLASIGGALTIVENVSLRDLHGLSSLETVGGEMLLDTLTHLESLEGVAKLREVGGGLTIRNMLELRSLRGLESLRSIAGTLSIVSNDRLTDLSALGELRRLGGLRIFHNDLLSLCAACAFASNIADGSIEGDVHIEQPTMGCHFTPSSDTKLRSTGCGAERQIPPREVDSVERITF
jgi:hypothetical protein